MVKRVLRIVVPVVIVAGALIIRFTHHTQATDTSTPRTNNSLHVINNQNQIYTNVTSDNLQSAAAPERSATNSSLTPQKAEPNYCVADEIPYIDGCVPRP